MRRIAVPAMALLSGSEALAQDAPFRVYEQLPGVGLSLMVVVALIVLVAWLLRRTPLGAFSRANGPLKIVATLPLGPKERLVLVETGGSRLLLGVAPAGIFRLNDPAGFAPDSVPSGISTGAQFNDLLQEKF
jgi:flagellar protein FliO/FliZ